MTHRAESPPVVRGSEADVAAEEAAEKGGVLVADVIGDSFDRLVGDGSGRPLDRSILDEVREDSHSLKPRISRNDKVKLDEYLESIRDIELRIERAAKDDLIEGWRPTLEQPDMPRPNNELPQNVPEHMKLMLDLVVLAFQMDKTRIATLMLNNDLSQMNFGFLPGVRGALNREDERFR